MASKRRLESWQVYALAGAIIFAVLIVTVPLVMVLRNDAQQGSDTTVSSQGISAVLPGSKWHRGVRADMGLAKGDTWEAADMRFEFYILRDTQGKPESTILELANTFAGKTYGASGYKYTQYDQTWHGQPSMVIETRGDGDDTHYHTIEHVLKVNGTAYIIGAGALNRIWDSGGKDAVTRILDSVQIK
jgi:hypothetical protein